MKIAIDTNILAYAEAVNGLDKQKAALALIDRLPRNSTYLPVQVLGELFYVLVKKARESRQSAHKAVLGWSKDFPLIEASSSAFFVAADLAVRHKLGIWDSMIIAAAVEAECHLLLSEDMQNGFAWRGLTIVNPLSSSCHPLLKTLLEAE